MTSQRRRDELVRRLREKGVSNESVLSVIRTMPRHLFIDEAMANRAYEDCALPIGHGQTISQPYTVARMTETILGSDPLQYPKKVLEVGTGSGYQAAVLAMLVPQFYSVERILGLHERAQAILRGLRLSNVRLKHSDGSWGWAAHGPYDAIIVTAAPEEVPQPLLEQLVIGGRLVIPVGNMGEAQRLLCITRTADGFEKKELDLVSFVPFLKGRV
ncbi:MAG: protein-L-isoaspartate(D-aspartate) O-methyltransferase [Gammaproteobacteria bacterium]|nr:protein-L-isoaspartate(D-aspartate) O-methyltransferase [Gammaproteobacteria bacterium]